MKGEENLKRDLDRVEIEKLRFDNDQLRQDIARSKIPDSKT